ncbi:hypothetical protein ANO14919_060540 [Xylariales sp. No.14919]|nr:hypothetical protein ANO14919_060540 [Xylariales sp. No.14919]
MIAIAASPPSIHPNLSMEKFEFLAGNVDINAEAKKWQEIRKTGWRRDA